MTDKQFDTQRNDLIDLIIEKIQRIVKDEQDAAALIEELEAMKH